MGKSKLVCFVIPYFGKLPNYFPLFLKSCEINADYDWLLLTDDHRPFAYPDNVRVLYTTFDQLKSRVEQCFPFKVSLPAPKKLCDFKPAYGFIFEEELKPYPYWGYCDVDLVLGDLGAFFDLTELKKYQKHFYLGHMSIYENTLEMRTLFLKGHPKKENQKMKYGFQDVLTSGKNMVFDEWSDTVETINDVAEMEHISINPAFPMLDIRPWRSRFYSTVFDPTVHTWIHNSKDNYIVVWDKGKLYAYSKEADGSLNKKEILYAHFQKRKMDSSRMDLASDLFLFAPNTIRSYDQITQAMIKSEMAKAILRRAFHVDENTKKAEDTVVLWKYRFNKYFRKSNKR